MAFGQENVGLDPIGAGEQVAPVSADEVLLGVQVDLIASDEL